MPTKQVYLSLGSNLGEREQAITQALAAMNQAGIRLLAQSKLYETAPQDVTDQPWFLNIAVKAETTLFPIQLLSTTQAIERELGRERRKIATRRGPRAIDIDLLLYGTSVIDCPKLVVPHPRMHQRRFVLQPLLEIEPDLRDPLSGRKYKELLSKLESQAVRVFSSHTGI